MTNLLTFDRKYGMYGTCGRIIARIGLAGEEFAQAHFRHTSQKWDVEIFNVDGSISEYSVDVSDDSDRAIDQVEALMNLAYRGETVRRAA